MTPSMRKALGVDIDALLVSQPDTGEQALEICEALVRSGAIDVVVVDSVAAMVHQGRDRGRDGRFSHVGLQARLMSQALRKLTGAHLQDPTPSAIFINQLREKVGVMYGNPGDHPRRPRAEVLLLRPSSTCARCEPIKDGGEIIGNRTRVKVVKNKVAPPFQRGGV